MLNLLKIKNLSSKKLVDGPCFPKNAVKLLDVSNSSEYLQTKNKLVTGDIGHLDFVLKETSSVLEF